MNTLEKVKQQIAEIQEKRNQLIAEVQKQFPEIFSDIFAQSDKLSSIGWRQYTPHFNDGEDCEFSTHFDYLYVNGSDEDENEHLQTEWVKLTEDNILLHKEHHSSSYGKPHLLNRGIGQESSIPNKNFDRQLANQVGQFREALKQIPDDLYKDLFGDHVKVTMYSTGLIETEEYDHD